MNLGGDWNIQTIAAGRSGSQGRRQSWGTPPERAVDLENVPQGTLKRGCRKAWVLCHSKGLESLDFVWGQNSGKRELSGGRKWTCLFNTLAAHLPRNRREVHLTHLSPSARNTLYPSTYIGTIQIHLKKQPWGQVIFCYLVCLGKFVPKSNQQTWTWAVCCHPPVNGSCLGRRKLIWPPWRKQSGLVPCRQRSEWLVF